MRFSVACDKAKAHRYVVFIDRCGLSDGAAQTAEVLDVVADPDHRMGGSVATVGTPRNYGVCSDAKRLTIEPAWQCSQVRHTVSAGFPQKPVCRDITSNEGGANHMATPYAGTKGISSTSRAQIGQPALHEVKRVLE